MNTVSLALRGSARLPEETKRVILEEAERLNYRPNHIARSLVNQATHTIGLVLTDIMNPTITLAARTIERKLANAGYAVMFAASDNEIENEKKAISLFQSYQVDGILIYPSSREDIAHIQSAHNAGYPTLLLADMPSSGLDVVAVDDTKGAFKAVSHLISQGHKNIVILDGAFSLRNNDKLDGAREAVRQAGLPENALTVVDPKGNTATHGYQAIQGALLATPRPTAVFATTDSLAIGAVRWCGENNLKVPQDLAVVGFDNLEASEFCAVPLTTINYAADEVSSYAVERIISTIENKRSDQTQLIRLIEPDLVIRSSA